MTSTIGDWTILLFAPADRPERFAKAAASGADAVIIDLEDSVAPAAKASARAGLPRAALAVPAVLRINALNTAWAEDDLAAAAAPFAAVMLPKPGSAADVARVHQATGLPVIALIETALGLSRARQIAAAPGAVRLAFGSFDYAADLGASPTRDALLSTRSELVLASRLAGLPPPIESPTLEFDQPALVEDDARHAATMGFGGKLCIHPAQVAPARAGFAPSAEQVRWAQAILAAAPDGATRVGATMVDAPIRARAERILAAQRKHDRAG